MRLKNTMSNVFWNIANQIALIIAGLFIKRILIHTLGTEKLGLNYLFEDMLNVMAIAEVGLTGIVAYHLYEALALQDEIRCMKIINFFRKAYLGIGIIVLMVGVCLIPLLPFFIGNTEMDYLYINLVFILMLLRNTEEYFLSYKSILAVANQKGYLVIRVDVISNIIASALSFVAIIATKNYLYLLMLEITRKIIRDLIVSHMVDGMYPFIKNYKNYSLGKEDIRKIGHDIRHAFIGKVSTAVIYATDNIIISKGLGLRITGLFSNYTLVLYAVQTLLVQVVLSAQASVGNLLVLENTKTVDKVIGKLTFMSFFLVSISGCLLMTLTTPFVSIFFGKEYVLEQVVVFICVCNIYLEIIQKPMIQLANAGGLFREIKIISLISCGINLVLSIIGINLFGIAGVLLGTFISRMVEVILRIKSNYSQIINISSISYYLKMMFYLLVYLGEVVLSYHVCNYINTNQEWSDFIIKTVISAIIPFAINVLIFCRTEEFAYGVGLIKMIFIDRIRKLGQ